MYWQKNGPAGPPEHTTYISPNSPPPVPREILERFAIHACGNSAGTAMLLYIGVSLLSSVLTVVLAALFFPQFFMRGALFYAPDYVNQLLLIVSYLLSLMLPFMIYGLLEHIPLGVALPFRRADASYTFFGVFVCLGLSIVAGFAANCFQASLGFLGVSVSSPEYPMPREPLALALYLVLMTLLPAFFEEMAFRGVLMQSLRRYGDGFALVVSSLLFGFFHLNLVQFPYAFILGLGLGYFTLRTGSLWCAVLSHFFNNVLSVFMQYAGETLSESSFAVLNLSLSLFLLAAGGLALFSLSLRDSGLFMLNPLPCSLSVGEKVSAFFGAPVMVISLVVTVRFTFSSITFNGFSLFGGL